MPSVTPSSIRFDFANILFGGPCNQRCPYCIGQQLPAPLRRNNLYGFPPRGLGTFVDQIRRHDIRQVVLTGTSTDPQLYRHEARLIRWLRIRLPGIQISLHTNGRLALAKIDTLNTYDKATISVPSFDPATFYQMTGTRHIPDLAAILRAARIPIKVSSVIGERNVRQLNEFLSRCLDIGVRRVVLRQLYGSDRQWDVLSRMSPAGTYRNNPVYDWHGIEVTYWRFENTTCAAINLFPDGTISTGYLLAKTA